MKPSSRLQLGALALGLLAAIAAVLAVLVASYAISKFGLPYNEEGRYFDGLVVHRAGSEYAFGFLAVVLGVVAVLAGVGARRLHHRARG